MFLITLYEGIALKQLHRVGTRFTGRKNVTIEGAVGCLLIDVLDADRRGTTRDNERNGKSDYPNTKSHSSEQPDILNTYLTL